MWLGIQQRCGCTNAGCGNGYCSVGPILVQCADLVLAFRHMRDPETDLVLWVDALCINQLDTTERSRQVALMGQIYSECAQVLIWLGCDASQCRLMQPPVPVGNEANDGLEGMDPFDIIRLLASGRHIYEWQCFQAQKEPEPDTLVYNPDDSFNMMCEGFFAVYRSPWWTRMWTVQEAILPRTGLVYFDTWKTSLQTITDCGKYYDNHAWKACCNYAVSQMPSAVGTALKDFCVVTQSLLYDRKRNEADELHRYNLQTQHVAYGFRGCEDPRDKVYGLLGIVNDRSLTPDYSLSKDEVFFQATYGMLCLREDSFSSLVGPQYGPKLGKLASWVCDFDAPYNRLDVDIATEWLRLYNLAFHNASDGHKSSPVLLRAPPRSADKLKEQVGLRVSGRRMAKVTLVSEDTQTQISVDKADGKKHVFRQWTLQALDWAAVDITAYINGTCSTDTGLNGVMRFWRTLLAGFDGPYHLWSSTESTFATTQWLDHFLAWVEGKTDMLNVTLSHILSVTTHGRCYFKAENNGQGLCYPHVRVGDEVWVLDGGKVPFILRPAHLEEETREALKPVDAEEFGGDEHLASCESRAFEQPPEGYYEFIGDCYCDGYMHGEAVRDSTIREQSIVLV